MKHLMFLQTQTGFVSQNIQLPPTETLSVHNQDWIKYQRDLAECAGTILWPLKFCYKSNPKLSSENLSGSTLICISASESKWLFSIRKQVWRWWKQGPGELNSERASVWVVVWPPAFMKIRGRLVVMCRYERKWSEVEGEGRRGPQIRWNSITVALSFKLITDPFQTDWPYRTKTL